MEQERIKELEIELANRLAEYVSSIISDAVIVEDYRGAKQCVFTLELSRLVYAKCKLRSYISHYGNMNNRAVAIYLGSDECEDYTLDDVKNHSMEFQGDEALESFFASDSFDVFLEKFKESEVFRYIVDEDFRSEKIRKREERELEYFERQFLSVIKFIGGKEVLRIMSPLNSIVTYGGDFESVKNLVDNISDIMSENRDLKKQLNKTKE